MFFPRPDIPRRATPCHANPGHIAPKGEARRRESNPPGDHRRVSRPRLALPSRIMPFHAGPHRPYGRTGLKPGANLQSRLHPTPYPTVSGLAGPYPAQPRSPLRGETERQGLRLPAGWSPTLCPAAMRSLLGTTPSRTRPCLASPCPALPGQGKDGGGARIRPRAGSLPSAPCSLQHALLARRSPRGAKDGDRACACLRAGPLPSTYYPCLAAPCLTGPRLA